MRMPKMHTQKIRHLGVPGLPKPRQGDRDPRLQAHRGGAGDAEFFLRGARTGVRGGSEKTDLRVLRVSGWIEALPRRARAALAFVAEEKVFQRLLRRLAGHLRDRRRQRNSLRARQDAVAGLAAVADAALFHE